MLMGRLVLLISLSLTVLISILACTPAAHSDDSYAGQVGLGIHGGWAFSAGQESVKNQTAQGLAYGGSLRYFFSPYYALDASFDHIRFETPENQPLESPEGNGTPLNLSVYTLNQYIHLCPFSSITPVLQVGAGPAVVHELNGERSVYTNLVLKGGTGFEIKAAHASVGLFGHYFYVTTRNTSATEIHGVNAVGALTVYF